MPRLDKAKLNRAFEVLLDGMRQKAYAGGVAAVGSARGIEAVKSFGLAVQEPQTIAMLPETRFDLASLTKVVATTPAILHLLESGAFVLETPVRQILPEFPDARVTIRHLLTHTSGLPAWKPLYLEAAGWDEYVAAICHMPLTADPGTQVVYSDLGFILLGAVIRQAGGLILSEYCRRHVFEPLGMSRTRFVPGGPAEDIAATEIENLVETGMCGERAPAFGKWRTGVIWGEVHDGNAWYGLNGISSHAGLFSNVYDLALYAQAWLKGGAGLLSRRTVALATRCHTPGMAEQRGLGWQKPPTALFPTGRASCGNLLSDSAFGHTGFTGTSLWIDPEQDLFIILLTNRVHPRASDGIYHFRPAFHNAVVASLR